MMSLAAGRSTSSALPCSISRSSVDAAARPQTAGAALTVGFVVRAQASDFPGEDEAQLFARARTVAARAIAIGYSEKTAQLHTVADPGDPARILDTWCELSLEKPVADLEAAVDEVRRAVAFDKAVPR